MPHTQRAIHESLASRSARTKRVNIWSREQWELARTELLRLCQFQRRGKKALLLADGWVAYSGRSMKGPQRAGDTTVRRSTWAAKVCPLRPPVFAVQRRELPEALRKTTIVDVSLDHLVPSVPSEVPVASVESLPTHDFFDMQKWAHRLSPPRVSPITAPRDSAARSGEGQPGGTGLSPHPKTARGNPRAAAARHTRSSKHRKRRAARRLSSTSPVSTPRLIQSRKPAKEAKMRCSLLANMPRLKGARGKVRVPYESAR